MSVPADPLGSQPMSNPYQSPQSFEETGRVWVRAVLSTAFFGVNCGGGILLLTAAVISIIDPAGSPYAFLGGIVLFGPCVLFILAECVAFFRGNRRVERLLGWTLLGLAAFTVFGIVTNVGEALLPPKPDRATASVEFMVWFVIIGTVISLYFGSCGLFRIRQTRSLQ